MKHLLNLIIILSLLAQVCHAQQAESVKENKEILRYDKKIESVKEYKVLYDSIASLVKFTSKDSINYVGITFSEFEKQLNKRGLIIKNASIGKCDCEKVYPKHVYGITLWFTNQEANNFAGTNDLKKPFIIVNFTESKPYETAFSLMREYKGYYNEEVESFYADAVIQSLYFYYNDDIYLFKHRLPSKQ